MKVINDIEVRLRWARGESPRTIARHFGVAKNTIVNHLRKFDLMPPRQPVALESANVPVLPGSVASVQPSSLTTTLPELAEPAPQAPPVPESIPESKLEPPPGIGTPTRIAPLPLIETDCNLGAIMGETKHFFLTDNKADAAVAWHLAQPALALQNGWHEDYSTLLAFQNAERIYLASSTGDHPDTLVAALAASSITAKVCVITQPIRDVCEARLWLQRTRREGIFEPALMASRPPAFFTLQDYVRRDRFSMPARPESHADRFRREHPVLYINEGGPADWKP